MKKAASIPADSVGVVETQHITLFQDDPLPLDCGATLSPVRVAYETYGKLNEKKNNVILVCHALSGSAHAAGYHSGESRKPGWWETCIGPGKPFDTNKFFIVCSNNLGGCYGTTGPSSTDPATGKPFGLRFPLITIGDMARVQKALVDALGIKQLLSVAGGSMGGMLALQWALDYPQMVKSSLIIAATPRLSAQNIAFNAVARQAILMDPHFNGGDYDSTSLPENGLALARMMAHITYLSEEGLHQKFGRRLQDREKLSYGFENDFAIESYLHYQGSSFVKRFDANTYLYITKAMDYFDPFSDPETTARRLKEVTARFLVTSFDTDWRFDTRRSKEMVRILNWHHKDVTFQEFSSPHGHDSFLLDIPHYKQTLATFLNRLYLEYCQRGG
ncbi:MAG: homoserine O-acetyltransferase [Magnetococcales bacterium]|nr:homoserine O-acetyltransferase [Magnetococcales bacterium]NGZ26888.1 homoserine O-acetyltransferase [Magnetococcales bacterium]